MVAAAAVAKSARDRTKPQEHKKKTRASVSQRASAVIQDIDNKTPKLPLQDKAKAFYNNQNCQLVVAALIVLNFFTTMAEKEFDPPFGEVYAVHWKALEDFFNIVFLLELLINFWGSFFIEFWKSGWNIFDFIVVSVGCLGLLRVDLPAELGLLRTLRAFRVFRLFKRVESLNKIIVSLGRAVPGVVNAMVIMVIVMCIYAIIAVEWFAEFGKAGLYNTYGMSDPSKIEVGALTSRGLLYGEEYYGTFTRALYTLWQVMTGESWSEAIARPLLFGYETPGRLSGFKVGFFFTSFLILTQIVLVNVVVAVLLEKMVDDKEDDEPEEEDEEDEHAEENSALQLGASAENGNGHEDGQEGSSPNLEEAGVDEEGNPAAGIAKKKSKTSVKKSAEQAALEMRSDISTLRASVDKINDRLQVVDDLDQRMNSMQDLLQQILKAQKGTSTL